MWGGGRMAFKGGDSMNKIIKFGVEGTLIISNLTYLTCCSRAAFEGCGGFLGLLNFESLLEEQVEPEAKHEE